MHYYHSPVSICKMRVSVIVSVNVYDVGANYALLVLPFLENHSNSRV